MKWPQVSPPPPGIPPSHRDHAQVVIFITITGHRNDGGLDANWALAAQAEHTTIFYIGLPCLGEIVPGLEKRIKTEGCSCQG